jgi:hypothetical protein
MKIILLGCGILTGLFILGMGSCAGVMYFVYQGTGPVAEVGADYLRKAPEIQTHYGPPVVVQRHKLGWNVQVVNDGGNARITYDVSGARVTAPGDGVVWLVRSGGKWSAVGATVQTPDGYSVTIGKPPAEHRIDLDD